MIDVVSSLMIAGTIGGFFTAGYKILDSKFEPVNKVLLAIQLSQANSENAYVKKDVYIAEIKIVDSKIEDSIADVRADFKQDIKSLEDRTDKRIEKIEQKLDKM